MMLRSVPTILCSAVLLLFGVLPAAGTALVTDTTAAAADTEAYRIYQPDGTAVTLNDVAAATDTVQVVFFGEQHNDPVAHALQDSLFRQLHARADTALARPVALSLEMFDRDVQYILDEYLAGHINEETFLQSVRPWSNYQTDYRPLVEFARTHERSVLAANAPRRYANMVSREGRDALAKLSDAAQRHLAPLPYPEASAAYRARWNRVMASGHGEDTSTDTLAADTTGAGMPHGGPPADTFLDAQVLWDATMAYSMAQHLLHTPDAVILHLAGSFHVDRGLGTPEQLQHYRPGTPTLVIVARPVADVTAFDERRYGSAGDFIILTDEMLPRSF
ncbi:MAG: hypothetical protein GVY12_14050 [Bacteroidetes bacterium]|jgi:uncharacterized iron-regulated protein|nr:hypothetical protein [Bacteroidota bacterium]